MQSEVLKGVQQSGVKSTIVKLLNVSPPTVQVLNKGKIVSAERKDVTGQLVTSAGFWVTAEMMPSFRVVAFYSIPWAGREELVSDSVWIDVVDGCVGGVSVYRG